MGRHVAVSNPNLAADPRYAVDRSLVDSTFGGVAIRYVMGHGVVTQVIHARVVFRNYFHVFCNCVVRPFIAAILNQPGGRFGVRRVIGGNIVEPVRLFSRAQPEWCNARFKIVRFNRQVYHVVGYLDMRDVTHGAVDVARA